MAASPAGTDRRAVFLDIDGTYADHGDVPPAHAAAVRRAREAGHLVFLCTGRPKSMVPARILAAGFDGFVGGAGAYVEVDGAVLADVRFPPEVAQRTVEVLLAHDVAFVLEAAEALWGPPGVDERMARHLAPHLRGGETRPRPFDLLDSLRMTDDLSDASFGKVSCVESPTPIPELAELIGPEVAALPSSIPDLGVAAGELYLAGMHKAVGMRIVVEAMGLDPAGVVAVGDGLNDVEMLAEAAVGVAIAGSHPRLLAVADRLAAGPAEEGLATLFADLGLL
ncbi:MAG: HAD family phosphatase [Propionibacteriaceae bacterium]|jgi:hydroxymethylpyrimidine pyrophosphatase-like HAD family hydrolase|nr:HAD family phosphatase [Propionibacteriaceae bacterium]HOA26745.1 HAD family hydrolase [Arachnia sp.]